MTATATIPAPPAVPAGLYRGEFVLRLSNLTVRRFSFDAYDAAVATYDCFPDSVLVTTATFMDDDGDVTERHSRWTGTEWTAWY